MHAGRNFWADKRSPGKQHSCGINNLAPRKGFVAQTWSWGTPLRRADHYQVYGPERVRFTPTGDNAGLGETALVNTGAYILLSQ